MTEKKVLATLLQGQNRFWNRYPNRFWNRYLNRFRNRNPRSPNNLLPGRRNRKRRRRSGRKLKNRSSRSASKVKNRFPTDFPAILPPTGSNRSSRRSRGTRRSRSSLRRSSGERVRAKIQVRFPPFRFSLAGFEPSNLGSRGNCSATVVVSLAECLVGKLHLKTQVHSKTSKSRLISKVDILKNLPQQVQELVVSTTPGRQTKKVGADKAGG